MAQSPVYSIITHFSLFPDAIFINHFTLWMFCYPGRSTPDFDHLGQRSVTILLAVRDSKIRDQHAKACLEDCDL